jgi:phospholipid/cholesterol/gamma-HCH transport system substrate-binding protein
VTRGVKIRLMAFLVLSAVGIVYVAGAYLGVVDRVLGRGLHVQATLPTSGGLFEGSEVTYRGLKVGKVTAMEVIPSGVRVSMTLEDEAKIPQDSPIFVHNLSAVGEQYLDIAPTSAKGPYLDDGDTLVGNAASMPVPEEQLLTELSSLVNSVNRHDLTTVVSELGQMFRGTAGPLQRMVDSGSELVRQARAHQQETIDLFDTGRTVLQTQADHEADIRSFARDLADVTQTLRSSDGDVRTILQGGPSTVRQVDLLLRGLEPTLPVFLSNLVTVNQVLTANLPSIEQTLVTFPRVLSSGFTGTPGDGYGHINLQLNNSVPPCMQGYLPAERWRNATDQSDTPVFPAKCRDPRAQPGYDGADGPPMNQRGVNFAPSYGTASANGRSYDVSGYDPGTGATRTGDGRPVVIGQSGGWANVFGDSSWQWMLVGPVTAGE